MDFRYTDEEAAFRDEVRVFIAESLPAETRRLVKTYGHLDNNHIPKARHQEWQRILFERGWGAPGWPVQCGGAGWDPVRRYIFEEEVAYGEAPPQSPFGLSMIGPVLYTFGSEAQKRKYLPKILNGEDWWCQGFSEPGSGSDLANVSTSAVRDGDAYVVNGQKTWTSLAHYANRMFCLVRTHKGERRQEGISMLLLDMDTPGLKVSPIVTMDGGHSVNEVFFDNVRVPLENLVGEEGKGWAYAKFLLGNERMGIADVGRAKGRLRQLQEMLDAGRLGGSETTYLVRAKVAQLEVDLLALEVLNLRSVLEDDTLIAGADTSMLKVRGTEILQAIERLKVQALGLDALGYDRSSVETAPHREELRESFGVTGTYLYSKATSIFGGTNEIQRNLVARFIFSAAR